jgi:hypothetical protein
MAVQSLLTLVSRDKLFCIILIRLQQNVMVKFKITSKHLRSSGSPVKLPISSIYAL